MFGMWYSRCQCRKQRYGILYANGVSLVPYPLLSIATRALYPKSDFCIVWTTIVISTVGSQLMSKVGSTGSPSHSRRCQLFLVHSRNLNARRLEDSGYPWRSIEIKIWQSSLIMFRIMNDSHTTTDVAIRARVCLTLNLNDLGSHPDTVVVRITRQRLLSGPLRHTETRFWSSCITDTDVGN